MADTATTHQDYLLSYERWLEDGVELLNGFTDPTFQGTKLRFLRHIQQDKMFVAARTGNVTAIGQHDSGNINPLLNNGPKTIMGKVVGTGSTPVTPGALAPTKDAVKKFKADVEDLYNNFLGLKDKDIIAILGKPGGTTILRGVAKKARVASAESIGTEDMDMVFFADIRTGIKEADRGTKLAAAMSEKLADNDSEEPAEEEEEAPVAKKAVPKKAVVTKKAAPAKRAAVLDDDDIA